MLMLLLFLAVACAGQFIEEGSDKLVWCTVSPEEQQKCLAFSLSVENDASLFGEYALKLKCKQGSNKDDCMSYLDTEAADITSLDAGDVFLGGRYHSLIPLMQEVYPGNRNYYYAVAVVKRGTLSDVHSLHDLRGKRACFSGVGSQAGWVIPVHTLMKKGGMEVIDCNNHVKSAIKYFGQSCAVNSLIDKYNPIGDNSDKLCELCIGRIPGQRCTAADPYAGFDGAFRCLVQAGDVAFLKHTTVEEMTRSNPQLAGVSKHEFELLCQDGTRSSVDDYQNCNWGTVPSHAIVTTSAKTRKQHHFYQKFLQKAVSLYGSVRDIPLANKTIPYENDVFNNNRSSDRDQLVFVATESTLDKKFTLFQSVPMFGQQHNLLVQDSARNLVPLAENEQTYTHYLGHSLDLIMGVRQCPVNRMTLCVTSDAELEKCIKMRTALKAQLLKPEMVCYKGHSQINCMQAIRSGNADVTVLDAGDVYTAGLKYDLIPFISEVYNLGQPEYYVVAVAKEEDPSTELTYLKDKRTCHTGINMAAGWIIPLAYLMSNGWIRSYGCNSVRAAAEYFTKSCVPGALSAEYNTGLPYDNMCHLCHGSSFRYCRRDASEMYFGHTGAFRCLVEAGGEVAFVKHTTVMENTDGKNKAEWARNTLTDDYELLCPDGTRAPMLEYERCNLGSVKANAIVARGGESYNETEMNAFINLFIYAQQLYGRKEFDDFRFSMFYSAPPYSDLIFQDATRQLKIIEPGMRHFSDYLGKDFMRARRLVDCQAGATAVKVSLLNTVFIVILPISVTLKVV